MRLLLLQEERHLPTFGGGHKANRRLLEELAARGHDCLTVCPAFNRDTTEAQFRADLAARGVAVRRAVSWHFRYAYRGVEVDGLATPDLGRRADWIRRRIASWEPDLVLVSDDGRAYLLAAALEAAPGRAVFLVHNHRHLPFGPFAARQDPEQHERLRRSRAVLVMSRYSRDYVALHGGLAAEAVALPVEESETPPRLGAPDNPYVTMVKPIPSKGVHLFLALAARFPEVEFAAVPTWGNTPDAAVLRELAARPNVRLLTPADDLGEVLARTRVLLVPSLLPETFGLVVPEAMARAVPVLASDVGGLPEAKLGVDYLLPVRAMETGAGEPPPQDEGPWAEALAPLLADRAAWEACADRSREAALKRLASIGAEPCERLLASLAEAARTGDDGPSTMSRFGSRRTRGSGPSALGQEGGGSEAREPSKCRA